MDAAQLEFAKKHGITHCPASPQLRMVWGGVASSANRPREYTEAELIALMNGPCWDLRGRGRLFRRRPYRFAERGISQSDGREKGKSNGKGRK